MKKYSQQDSRWANLKIWNTKLTIGKYGCYIVSIAMIDGRTPDVINKILADNNCFNIVGLLLNEKAAKVLGYKYKEVKKDPKKLCIAVTDYYKDKGFPQHFFVWLGYDMQIIDSLDGLHKTINRNKPISKTVVHYGIKSYRIFEKIK